MLVGRGGNLPGPEPLQIHPRVGLALASRSEATTSLFLHMMLAVPKLAVLHEGCAQKDTIGPCFFFASDARRPQHYA
jgi:hypothetical protein